MVFVQDLLTLPSFGIIIDLMGLQCPSLDIIIFYHSLIPIIGAQGFLLPIITDYNALGFKRRIIRMIGSWIPLFLYYKPINICLLLLQYILEDFQS